MTEYPDTPAAIAQAALEGIYAHEAAFNMNDWYLPNRWDPGVTGGLAAHQEPPCGTTMCAAGWVAHVAGWHLVFSMRKLPAYVKEDTTILAVVFAEKDGRRLVVSAAAEEALGISGTSSAPWYGSKDDALDFLEHIAGSG